MSLQTIAQDGFDELLKEGGVTLVEFGAVWCPPCRALLPILEEIAGEYGSSVTLAKIDADHSPELASAYGIMGLPTVLVFKDGEWMDKRVGLLPKAAYKTVVDRLLGA